MAGTEGRGIKAMERRGRFGRCTSGKVGVVEVMLMTVVGFLGSEKRVERMPLPYDYFWR